MEITPGRRSGRARIGDLVLYDLLLLLAVLGLMWGEQKLTAEELERQSAAPVVVKQDPPPTATATATEQVATTTQSPPRPANGVTRVTTEPAAAPMDDARARRDLERLAAEARAAFDAGQVDAAFERYLHADAALKVSPMWAEVAAPALAKLTTDAVATDTWRGVLADAQLLADAGQVAPVDALLQRWGSAPALQKERDRAQARATLKPPSGFQIKGFVPDDAKAEGRRCFVEGGIERARLLEVRDALDVLLAHASSLLGRELAEPLTLKVLTEDAPPEAARGLTVTTHSRAGEGAGDLVDRARLLAARAAVDAGPQVAPWAREAFVRALAGATPAGRAPRPSLTRPGHAWRRQALATATAERLVASLRAAPDPAIAFALGFAALWGGPGSGAEPLRRALDDARAGREATLTADEARALAAALPTLLEPS